ncbi:hypothetical protein K438DRAFT_1861078 [Mycena galopus ATCC 62051]|nr:hypothetical protein K438DRAFT_1861078 [Mycena galopus ATCC 62051]
MGITTFEHDVTKPFPTEYLGSFDLVHISFLFLCLTKDGWNATLNNVQELLSPGGAVMIDELDPVLFKDGEYERPATSYDLAKHMAGDSWIHKLNALYTGFIVRNNFLVGLTLRLPEMLEHAGLVVVHSDIRTAGIGKPLRHLKGADGGSLALYEESSLQNLEIMINQFVTIMRKTETLEVPPGTRIVEEEKVQSILAEVNEGLQTEGVICVGGCFVAKKT